MASRMRLTVLLGVIALAGLAAILGYRATGGLEAAADTRGVQAAPIAQDPTQPEAPGTTGQGDSESLDLAPIDSPSATCYRPVAGSGACYLAWQYLYAAAAPSAYVVSMTLTIDGRLRAYFSGFFQNQMIIDSGMYQPGFRVVCGFPDSGAIAGMGKTYTYVISARDTSGPPLSNYGSVTCPADVVKVYLPVIVNR